MLKTEAEQCHIRTLSADKEILSEIVAGDTTRPRAIVALDTL
jgi:hypothetical protein